MNKAEIINVEESEVQVTVDVIVPMDIDEIVVTTALEPPFITGTPEPGQLAEWVDATHLQGIPDIAAFIVGPGPFPGKLAVFVDGHHIKAGGDEGSVVHAAPPTNFTQLAGFADPVDGTLIQGVDLPAAGLKRVGPVLILTDDLAALEGLTGTNTIYYRSGVSAWSAVQMSGRMSFTGGVLDGPGYLPLAGGTMSGSLSISMSTPVVSLYAAANTPAKLIGSAQSSGQSRWAVNLIDGTAESGGNSGSNFLIQRFADNGAFIDNPLTINRATGLITIPNLAPTGLWAGNNIWTGQNFFNPGPVVIGSNLIVTDPTALTKLHVHDTAPTTGINVYNWASSFGTHGLWLSRSKSGTIGTHAAVVDNDILGQISFRGSDGAGFFNGAAINVIVEGAVATGKVPGKLTFLTRFAGDAGLTQRLLIDSAGRVVAGPAATSFMGGYLSLAGASAAAATFCNECYVNSSSGATIALRHSRGATVGALASLQLNDAIGSITFEGVDSVPSMTSNGAFIQVNVDAAPTTNHIPSRFAFWTDDGTTIAERMRLTRGGALNIFNGGTAPPTSLQGYLGIAGLTAGTVSFQMECYQAAAGAPIIFMKHSRGAFGAQGALVTGDPIAVFRGAGSDGINFIACVEINFICESTPTSGHVPTQIIFQTDNGTNFAIRAKIFASGGISNDTIGGFLDPGAGGIAANTFIGALKGVADASSAASGYVGQVVTATQSTNTPLTSGVAATITSLVNLPAGDWDVFVKSTWTTGGTAGNAEIEVWTGTTITGTIAQYMITAAPIATGSFPVNLGVLRVSIAAPTTINLVARSSAANMAVTNAYMLARRRR